MNYIDKVPDYFSNVRHDLLSLMDKKANGLKVLEIGAAYGETLYYLKQSGIAAEAVGIDIFEDVSNKQNYKPLDRFIFGDMEKLDFPEYYGYFDVILLPDVLEHLIEPKNVLSKVKKYLNDENGVVLVSMPNIRHYTAFVKIFVKGNFGYESNGIFDYTHMRFYCRKNMAELLLNAGFSINNVRSSVNHYKGRSFSKILNKITFGAFEEFLSVQYFFSAEKPNNKS